MRLQGAEFDIVSVHADKTSAYEAREELVFNYVTDKDGCRKGMIPAIYNTSVAQGAADSFIALQAANAKSQNMEECHYITRDVKTNLSGLTVWQKTVTKTKGWTGQYIESKYTPLFTISIVNMAKEVMPKYRCISYVEVDEVEVSDEELIDRATRNDRLSKSRTFTRLRRISDTDASSAPKPVSVSRLRFEFSHEYVKCPMTKSYTPQESTAPSKDELAKEVVAKHQEMQKKKSSLSKVENMDKVDGISTPVSSTEAKGDKQL